MSHDCSIGEDAFDQVVRPIEVEGQRASALRFGDARVQALLSVLVLFSFQLRGFTNQEMRALLAQLLGLDPAHYSVGRMIHDLRRLRRKALIRRRPRSNTYVLTPDGIRVANFYTKIYGRLLRPLLAVDQPPADSQLRQALRIIDAHVATSIDRARLHRAA